MTECSEPSFLPDCFDVDFVPISLETFKSFQRHHPSDERKPFFGDGVIGNNAVWHVFEVHEVINGRAFSQLFPLFLTAVSLNGSHFGEDETMQMHGQFGGFPLTKVHEVWVGVIV